MKFDWIGVRVLSSGNGKIFGEPGSLGARVMIGVRKDDDDVEAIEVPVLIENGDHLTVSQARDAALKEAVNLLRNLVSEIDGRSYDELAEQQDRQDTERDKVSTEEFSASLSAALSQRKS